MKFSVREVNYYRADLEFSAIIASLSVTMMHTGVRARRIRLNSAKFGSIQQTAIVRSVLRFVASLTCSSILLPQLLLTLSSVGMSKSYDKNI